MVLLRSTYGSEADAQAAATRLVERGFAACVHIAPIASTYRWQGKLVQEQEWALEARTTTARQDACWEAILDRHPYDNPLVEVLGTTQVPVRYAKWAAQATRTA